MVYFDGKIELKNKNFNIEYKIHYARLIENKLYLICDK